MWKFSWQYENGIFRLDARNGVKWWVIAERDIDADKAEKMWDRIHEAARETQ